MGRTYPNLVGDPVETHGYYYSRNANKLARLKVGDKLPRHMGPWELIATDEEGTSSEILHRLRQRYPDLDPYRLSFATSTPVDLHYLARVKRARLAKMAALGALVFGLGLLLVGNRERRRLARSERSRRADAMRRWFGPGRKR